MLFLPRLDVASVWLAPLPPPPNQSPHQLINCWWKTFNISLKITDSFISDWNSSCTRYDIQKTILTSRLHQVWYCFVSYTSHCLFENFCQDGRGGVLHSLAILKTAFSFGSSACLSNHCSQDNGAKSAKLKYFVVKTESPSAAVTYIWFFL